MCGAQSQQRHLRIALAIPSAKQKEIQPNDLRVLCTECEAGVSGQEIPLPPTRIALLTQIRRATIADQRAICEWLQTHLARFEA
jgi:hypothetical protein